MKKKGIVFKGCLLVLAMSLFLTACGKNSDDNAVSQTQNGQEKQEEQLAQSEPEELVEPQAQSEPEEQAEPQAQNEQEVLAVAMALEESVEEEPYVPAVNVNPEAREDWETASLSGSLEAYEDYFKLDMKEYTRKCEKAGKVETITYYSEAWGAERSAQVYTPYGYNVVKEYPVIYLIHGIGCDSTQWVSMGVQNMFDHMIANGELQPFVAVFPSVIPVGGLDPNTLSNTNVQAFVTFVEEFKKDLHPYMNQYYHVSKNRDNIAICGLSMGGMEALRVGFTYLDTFNYIGSFSAAPTLETELLTTANSEYVPELVLICSGDKDGTVGDNPFNYHSTLSKNGVEHIWYVHPKEGHSPTVWNLGLFNFLKRLSGGFLPK